MQVKTCVVCGKRSARYVCQECGREVCEVCLEPRTWVCSDCYSRVKPEAPAPAVEDFPRSVPFKLFLFGFLLIFIGMIVVVVTAVLSGIPATMGTIIFLGPIPIILGAGPYSLWAIMLAAVLTILGVVLFLTLRKRA